MILGLRTVIYQVPDLEKARDWYSRVLGQQPYFAEPYYVGFRVGVVRFRVGVVGLRFVHKRRRGPVTSTA